MVKLNYTKYCLLAPASKTNYRFKSRALLESKQTCYVVFAALKNNLPELLQPLVVWGHSTSQRNGFFSSFFIEGMISCFFNIWSVQPYVHSPNASWAPVVLTLSNTCHSSSRQVDKSHLDDQVGFEYNGETLSLKTDLQVYMEAISYKLHIL